MEQVWNRFFLEQAGAVPPMLATLLLVTGVIILLLGWRLSRVVATLDFSIFGLFVGAALTLDTDVQWLCAGTGAVAFGAMALWLDHYSEVIAGGLIAGLAAGLFMSWLGAPLLGTVLVIAAAFACAVAFSLIVAREATAVMTAVQGGLLAAFGLAACLACNPSVWFGMREVLAGSSMALLMFVFAPVGVGVTFQLASIQNEEIIV